MLRPCWDPRLSIRKACVSVLTWCRDVSLKSREGKKTQSAFYSCCFYRLLWFVLLFVYSNVNKGWRSSWTWHLVASSRIRITKGESLLNKYSLSLYYTPDTELVTRNTMLSMAEVPPVQSGVTGSWTASPRSKLNLLSGLSSAQRQSQSIPILSYRASSSLKMERGHLWASPACSSAIDIPELKVVGSGKNFRPGLARLTLPMVPPINSTYYILLKVL